MQRRTTSILKKRIAIQTTAREADFYNFESNRKADYR
jgi:hypothetical protein